jgi:hypothetical protein
VAAGDGGQRAEVAEAGAGGGEGGRVALGRFRSLPKNLVNCFRRVADFERLR